jgi:two-component system response regulator RegA
MTMKPIAASWVMHWKNASTKFMPPVTWQPRWNLPGNTNRNSLWSTCESGLELVKQLSALDENTRIVMLTGFASVATAVEAIKLGAVHYLAKPATADEVVAALQRTEGDASVAPAELPLSIKRLEWEHLQKVLAEHNGNISAAARALKMHRRTLQRKLAKHPVKE